MEKYEDMDREVRIELLQQKDQTIDEMKTELAQMEDRMDRMMVDRQMMSFQLAIILTYLQLHSVLGKICKEEVEKIRNLLEEPMIHFQDLQESLDKISGGMDMLSSRELDSLLELLTGTSLLKKIREEMEQFPESMGSDGYTLDEDDLDELYSSFMMGFED